MANHAAQTRAKEPAAKAAEPEKKAARPAAAPGAALERAPAWTGAWQDQPPAGLFSLEHGIQAKLEVSQPNDPAEEDAEKFSRQVLAKPVTPSLASQSPAPRGQAANPQPAILPPLRQEVPSSVHQALQTPGRALEQSTRAQMQGHLDIDLSQVRIHTGPQAAQSAAELRANAYTVGHNIVFGPGQYAAGTQRGQRLLAHELRHVEQQANHTVRRSIQRQDHPAPATSPDARRTALLAEFRGLYERKLDPAG